MKNKLDRMSHLWDTKNLKTRSLDVRIFEAARKEIIAWPAEARKELGSVLTRLQKRESIGMPDVRPMPQVGKGVLEIRIRIEPGIFRVFYVIETRLGVLVFHGFSKKTQKTPKHEIVVGQQRLKAFLKELGQ